MLVVTIPKGIFEKPTTTTQSLSSQFLCVKLLPFLELRYEEGARIPSLFLLIFWFTCSCLVITDNPRVRKMRCGALLVSPVSSKSFKCAPPSALERLELHLTNDRRNGVVLCLPQLPRLPAGKSMTEHSVAKSSTKALRSWAWGARSTVTHQLSSPLTTRDQQQNSILMCDKILPF